MIAHARERGVRISAETCPHYLCFDADEIPDGATEFKCAPPIRGARRPRRAVAALVDGRPRHDRLRPFAVSADSQAAGRRRFLCRVGRDRVAATRRVGRVDGDARARRCRSSTLVRWMSAAPARLAGLGGAQRDASRRATMPTSSMFDPDDEFTVRARGAPAQTPAHAVPWCAVARDGRATYVRGTLAYRSSQRTQRRRRQDSSFFHRTS